MFNNQCCTNTPTKDQLRRCLSVKEMLTEQNYLNNQLSYGEAWSQALSVDHYLTAIVAEFGEFLDQETSPQYKWWKTKDPELYSTWMNQLEIVDIIHFYLSIAIINMRDLRSKLSGCPEEGSTEFSMYDNIYVGSDQGVHSSGKGLVENPNVLNHSNFMDLVKGILCKKWDIFDWVTTLASLTGSMGMSCEKLSALYYGKTILNKTRWENPDWEKIDVAGLEDNERLFPLVEAYLADKTLNLRTDFRQMVEDEFFTQV